MLFGMILSVLKNIKILGKFNFMSKPYSDTLKKLSLGLAKSFEEPILPLAAISNVSAPLKTFLIESDVVPEIPKS